MRGARGSLCEKREARCVRSERFARCHAGGSRRRKREVRCARSGRFALNRAKTSLLAVSTTHMLDLGRSISHCHFPTWAFTRSEKRTRVAITLNRECGSRFFADRARKRDLARMSKRTPPSRFALARTRSADPPPLAQHSGEKLAAKPPAAREGVFDPASGAKPQAAGDLESRFLQQGVVEELPFGQCEVRNPQILERVRTQGVMVQAAFSLMRRFAMVVHDRFSPAIREQHVRLSIRNGSGALPRESGTDRVDPPVKPRRQLDGAIEARARQTETPDARRRA